MHKCTEADTTRRNDRMVVVNIDSSLLVLLIITAVGIALKRCTGYLYFARYN